MSALGHADADCGAVPAGPLLRVGTDDSKGVSAPYPLAAHNTHVTTQTTLLRAHNPALHR